jgi:hypothetical protein
MRKMAKEIDVPRTLLLTVAQKESNKANSSLLGTLVRTSPVLNYFCCKRDPQPIDPGLFCFVEGYFTRKISCETVLKCVQTYNLGCHFEKR